MCLFNMKTRSVRGRKGTRGGGNWYDWITGRTQNTSSMNAPTSSPTKMYCLKSEIAKKIVEKIVTHFKTTLHKTSTELNENPYNDADLESLVKFYLEEYKYKFTGVCRGHTSTLEPIENVSYDKILEDARALMKTPMGDSTVIGYRNDAKIREEDAAVEREINLKIKTNTVRRLQFEVAELTRTIGESIPIYNAIKDNKGISKEKWFEYLTTLNGTLKNKSLNWKTN